MQLKNGWLEVLELLALFLPIMETCDAKNSWEFFVDAIFYLVKIRLKREGQTQSEFDQWKFFNLAPHLAKNFSSYIAICIHRRFWILSFLQLKLWARMLLQIGDSPSAVFLYLYVNFHKGVSVAFSGEIWPATRVQWVLQSWLTSNLQI